MRKTETIESHEKREDSTHHEMMVALSRSLMFQTTATPAISLAVSNLLRFDIHQTIEASAEYTQLRNTT